MKESELQKEIKDMLDSHPLVAHCHTTTTGMLRGIKSNTIIKVGTPGLPDIVGQLKSGVFFGLEIKLPGKKPNEDQLKFIARVNENNGIAGWVDSLEAAKDLLKE